MSDSEFSEKVSREEMISAHFANMILQQANMALMFLGKTPHPETGEDLLDVETARLFIDQLEMLEVKTKGNLDKREESLLQESLIAVRMAFVGAADGPCESGQRKAELFPASTPATSMASSSPDAPKPAANESAAETESRRKFSKKY